MRILVRKERAPGIAAVVWYFLVKLSLSTEGTQVTRKQMAAAALFVTTEANWSCKPVCPA